MSEVPLGELLTLKRQRVTIESDCEYRRAGVLSYGRGLFSRPPALGSETSYPSFYRLTEGQLVFSKLFAWEGALAIVGPEHAGAYVSQEFPTFDVNTDRITPGYLARLCAWPELWARLRAGESGMGGRRKRVHQDRLLETTVPLPGLDEQHRVVDLLNSVEAMHRATADVAEAATLIARALRARHFAVAEGEPSTVGQLFDVTIGRQRSPVHATGTHMRPYLRAANVKNGHLDLSDVKEMNFDPLEQLKYRLHVGDVLVTEGCGSLTQLGASAHWSGEIEGQVCFQNTLIRLRGKPEVSVSDYSYQWARHAFESGLFASLASGTNIFHIGSTRLAEVPVVALTLEEQMLFVDQMTAVDQVAESARTAASAAHTMSSQLADALLSGVHRIPDTYDVVMRRATG